MEPDPSKTSGVCDWSTPSDTSNLRSFLGPASYHQRYIHRFSEIAAPLHQLTNKGVTFKWTESCQLAFNQLKKKLTEAPVLAYPQLTHQLNNSYCKQMQVPPVLAQSWNKVDVQWHMPAEHYLHQRKTTV